MKARLSIVMAALLWTAETVSAHRLDELLQATTIAVEKTRVTIQLRLTPGVAVVRAVLDGLDTNGDGMLSEAERRAYIERVQRDLSLTVDGNRLPLRLVSASFPSIESMQAGLGDILLTFRAEVFPGGPDRKLSFENRYQSTLAVYLVNCLFPEDPGIRIATQNRNYEQSFYQVNYAQMIGAQQVQGDSARGFADGKNKSWDSRQSVPKAHFPEKAFRFLAVDGQWLVVGVLVLGGAILPSLMRHRLRSRSA